MRPLLVTLGIWIIGGLSVVGLAGGAPEDSLLAAAKRGDGATVRTLLRQAVNVNAAEEDGMTALHWSVLANDLQNTALLIGAGANAKASSRYGITPLSLAATNGNAAMIAVLLKAGADVNVAGPSGETALMIAARTGKLDAVNELLAHGANVNAKEQSQEQTALMWAAFENHAAVVKALIEHGAELDARSKILRPPEWKWFTAGMVSTSLPRGGWTALMYAARRNAADAAAVLADAGARLDLTDPDGSNALILAIINAHFDVANLLLEKGADPNVADETNMASLYAAVDMHTLWPMTGRPVPVLVDKLDAVDLVKALLAHGADPNTRLERPVLGRHHDLGDSALGEGTTPLMRAAKSNDIVIMRLLLEAGADPTLTQKDYTNALMIETAGGARVSPYPTTTPVTADGALEGLALLLDHGVDINAFNTSGQTALHLAAARGADRIVTLLAERGATLDSKNRQGQTPLDLALGVRRRSAGRQGGAAARPSTAALLRQLMSKSAPQAPAVR